MFLWSPSVARRALAVSGLVAVSCSADADGDAATQAGVEDSIPTRAEGVDDAQLHPSAEPGASADSPPESLPVDLQVTFDAESATEFEARIVDLNRTRGWVACGYFHTVGAIEVEVLGHGDPGPHLMLFVSCPGDYGRHSPLVVDAGVQVRVFKKPQLWQPKPPKGYRTDVPVRYAKRITGLDASL